MNNFFRKRIVKIILGFFATVVLFLVLLPFGIKYYLIDWLEKNGAKSASIETLSYNPFLGRITLGGLDVQGGERSILNHSSLVIDVSIFSLFKRDIRFEKAEYTDLFIDMEQYEDGSWRYGSVTIQGGVPQEQELNPPDLTAPETTRPQWGFRADNVLVNNCSLHLKTPTLDMTLLIEQGELNRFTTRKGDKAGVLSITGKIDDSPITLQLDNLQIVPEIRVDGNIEIAEFNLHELAELLETALPTVNGMFGLNGKVLFTMSDSNGIQLDYNGAISIDAADIGSNDFKSNAKSFEWDGSIQYAAPPADAPSQLTTDGLLAVRELELQLPGTNLSFTNSNLELQGKTHLTLSDTITLANDGSLSLQKTALKMPEMGFTEEQLSWKGQITFEAAGPASKVHTAGGLELEGIHFNSNNQQSPVDFLGKKVSWSGSTGVIMNTDSKQTTVELDGTLLGGTLHTSIMEPPLRLDQERISLKTRTSLALGEKLGVKAKSTLEISAFKFEQGEAEESLAISFDTLTINELLNNGPKSISVDDLHTTNFEARLPGNLPLAVTIPKMQLANLVTDDLVATRLGSFELQDLQAISILNGKQFAGLEQLNIQNITSGEETLFAAENIGLTKLTLLPSTKGDAFLSLASTEAKMLSWGGKEGLQGDTLDLNTLIVAINKDKNGEINFNQQLQTMQKPAPEEQPEQKSTEKAVPADDAQPAQSPAIKLKAITISDKSLISFTDQTLAVPYTTNLKITEFFIKDLDSSQPDKKANLLLDGTLEKKAPIKISGTLAPFKAEPDINLDLVLKNYPLSNLSPYTVQSIGTALASGNLRVKSKLALANNTIDLKNHVVLGKLKTKTISPELAAELSNQLPVPLDAALAMMRDNDENITLDIPISGPLDDVSVGITQIIVTALNKSIVSAASSYFVYTLGPYAALAYVGMKVGEQMLEVNLPPVIFDTQETLLTEDHKGYLERIGKILTDQPEKDLRLTPKVAAWELYSEKEQVTRKEKPAELSSEMEKQLKELGQQRAEEIKKNLTGSHGIDKIRLLVSDTVIEKGKDVQPLVLLEVK